MSEISEIIERRRSYLLGNRIIINPPRVTIGQPRNVKVIYIFINQSKIPWYLDITLNYILSILGFIDINLKLMINVFWERTFWPHLKRLKSKLFLSFIGCHLSLFTRTSVCWILFCIAGGNLNYLSLFIVWTYCTSKLVIESF